MGKHVDSDDVYDNLYRVDLEDVTYGDNMKTLAVREALFSLVYPGDICHQ